jgi:hypothetical protein
MLSRATSGQVRTIHGERFGRTSSQIWTKIQCGRWRMLFLKTTANVATGWELFEFVNGLHSQK